MALLSALGSKVFEALGVRQGAGGHAKKVISFSRPLCLTQIKTLSCSPNVSSLRSDA